MSSDPSQHIFTRPIAAHITAGALAMVVAAILTAAGRAETPPPVPKGAAGEAQSQPPKPPAGMPDLYRLNILIRTTLLALNQANTTGNYSVFRDLASPKFQAANTDAGLGEVFSFLRKRNLDLSPIIFFDPKLVRPPRFEASGMLRLTGYIPTAPEQVLFDLGFEQVNGRWLLSAIVVDMRQNPDASAAATAEKATPAKAEKPAAKAKQAPSPTAAEAARPTKGSQ